MLNLKKFYKKKKIFITGHTGFKGTWLTQIMVRAGAEVAGFSLPANEDSHFNGLGLKKLITHHEGDIRDENTLIKSLNDFKPDIVFHLAAQALVRLAYLDPISTYSTNVMGSLNLLEAINECSSVRSLVYITSDKCYENVEWVWGYKETDLLGGHDPYSSSKAAAELLYSSYKRSYFDNKKEKFGSASARAGNVIGGGDYSADRIVPDCIKAIRKGEPIQLRNPNSTRPWQHVLEPLSGYINLAIKLYKNPNAYSKSWNFGPNTEEVKNVGYVAQKIVEIYGKGSVAITAEVSDFHEANLLQLNCDLAHQELDWHPRWNVSKTLESTANWYRLVDNGKSMEEVTNLQINDYFGIKND